MLHAVGRLVRSRELLLSLAVREIKVRYKQSLLGIAWAVAQPLGMMVIFTVVFTRFVRIPSDGIPYPLFSYVALLAWSFLATSLSFAISSLVANASLITKVYFPREVLPLASILAACVDFGIATAVFGVMLVLYKVELTLMALYLIPIFLLQLLLVVAIALFGSAVNVFYRDVKYAIPFAIQVWMYLSPVIYPVSAVPDRFRGLYMLNPMAPIIDSYRRVALLGVAPELGYLGIAAALTLLMLLWSFRFFKRVEMWFADRI